MILYSTIFFFTAFSHALLDHKSKGQKKHLFVHAASLPDSGPWDWSLPTPKIGRYQWEVQLEVLPSPNPLTVLIASEDHRPPLYLAIQKRKDHWPITLSYNPGEITFSFLFPFFFVFFLSGGGGGRGWIWENQREENWRQERVIQWEKSCVFTFIGQSVSH